jgi:CRISPR system Cascade subunit CasB
MIDREHRVAAAAWWHDLQPDPAKGKRGDRGALARLRRCATVAEAMSEPTTMSLARRCVVRHPDDLTDIALAAAVLAHVRQDRPGLRVARQVGVDERKGPEAPETALLKPLRFQRLMTAETPDERLAAMRRLVALADGALNVRDLAESLLDWTEERRRRWTYDYWGVGIPTALLATPQTDDAA